VLFQGPCWEGHTDDWAARVQVSGQGVANSIDGIRQTMTDAGYLDTDYDFAVMSYPSPAGPDVEDNPDFPGWYSGGCMMYLADLAFARNKAVPMFDDAIRDAVVGKGVRYLNGQPLFDGHGVCEDNTWVRGLYVEVGELPSENAFRQSFHPNERGHGAFASCMTEFFDNPDWMTATCADPASTGDTRLYQGLMDHQDIKDADTGWCVDAKGYDSRNGTVLQSYGCDGARNQGFWFDEEFSSLHVELSHDRCVDAAEPAAGIGLTLRNCDGGESQQFTVDESGLHPSATPALCAGFDGEGEQSTLVLTQCGGTGTHLGLADRDYPNPAGYGHDDWIGSSVY
ncbi:MAG: ricin-type beta-trefoil lectin domain protein, partial [Stackebrandtia sp.]